MMHYNLYDRTADLLSRGESAVLVSVRASEGSSPRHAGAQMLVAEGLPAEGTIGGGALEHRALETAKSILEHGGSRSAHYDLSGKMAASVGMICGGSVMLDFRYLSPDDPDSLSWVRDMRESAKESGKTVYVFGGGHVSQAVVPLLRSVGFYPVVLEDRPEFLQPDLFPDAAALKLIDMHAVAKSVPLTPDDYILILTRGHEHDLLVQSQVMRMHPAYIGVIGSRTKTQTLTDHLIRDGFTSEDFCNVFAPVGLPIGSETPEEIAVSIAAQLIAVRAKGREAARRLSWGVLSEE